MPNNKNGETNKQIQRKRILMYFIEATQQIMENEGIEKITIRKVADLAGYNSATLYNYFDNLNHLITFASLKYLEEYNQKVVDNYCGTQNIYDIYMEMWRVFCETAFTYPKVFLHIFFNEYKEEMIGIVKEYYEIFPIKDKAAKEYPAWLEDVKLEDRNRIYLVQLAAAGQIKEQEIDIINDITMALTHNSLVNISRQSTEEPLAEQIDRFIAYIQYLIIGV